MQYNFDEHIDRTGTHAAKTDNLPKGAPPDALPLWVADMDLPCALPILEALHRRTDRRILGYTVADTEEYREVFASWQHRRFGWKPDLEDIIFSPGVVPSIAFLINILSEKGDGIIIQRPVYYPFSHAIENNERRIINSPLIRSGSSYEMDWQGLESAFAQDDARGMILCSPHNPVGRVWRPEELERLVSIASKYGKWIISDEIHADLTRRTVRHHPLPLIAPSYAEQIIVCSAPSKAFNLAGMQFSSVVIKNREWKERWRRFVNGRLGLYGCPPMGLAAALAAYREGEDWLDQARAYIDDNIEFARAYIKEHFPKATLCDCEGTYLIWIDFSPYCADSKALETLMMQKARVALDEGYIFGDEGRGYERINIACPRSLLTDCLDRIRKAFKAEGWL